MALFPGLSENAAAVLSYFEQGQAAKTETLEKGSDESFENYITLRNTALELTGELLAALSAENYIDRESQRALETIVPIGDEIRAAILEEAQYCKTLLE
jgi:hypothetical protein